MRKIQAMPLDREAFAPFGEYYDMLHPSGYALAGEIHKFYPDRIDVYKRQILRCMAHGLLRLVIWKNLWSS